MVMVKVSESLASLKRQVHEIACEKGWWGDKHPWTPEQLHDAKVPWVASQLMNIVSELAEAHAELARGNLEVRYEPNPYKVGGPPKPEGFPVELADALSRMLDLCEGLGVDVEAVLLEKMAFNRTRPHLHGGKLI